MRGFGKRLDGPGGRRAAARQPVLLNAGLMTLQDSRVVTLIDVSKTGAKMRSAVALSLGQSIWLKIRPTDIFGTIAWIDGDHAGVAFDEPLTDANVRSLQARGRIVVVAGLSLDQQLGAEDWQAGLMR